MAITSSAKKAIRNSARKHVFNLQRKRAIDSVKRDMRKLVKAKKIDEAKALLPRAYKAIDKAEKTNLIKKNTASRMKSRITLSINKLGK